MKLGMRTIGIFGVVATLMLAACGGDDDTPTPRPTATKLPATATPAPVATTAPTPTAEPTFKRGGTLKYAYGAPSLTHLDPIGITRSMVHMMVALSYSRLVGVDRGETPADVFFATDQLAEDWEISADGKTITFDLRRAVKYHDVPPVNGRELTSADVKFSLERAAFDPASLFQGSYKNVDSFEAPEPYTFIIKLKQFDADLMNLLAAHHGWITAKEVVDEDGDLKSRIVGTGPYIFERWDQDVALTFRANPDYFIEDLPYVDTIEQLIINDPATRTAVFRTEQTCCIDRIGVATRNDIVGTNPNVREEKQPVTHAYTMFMRVGNPLFDDVRVRQAISLGVNPQSHIDAALDGDGLWRGPVSGQHGPYALTQEELKSDRFYFRYDPDEAKALLAAAGVAPSTEIPFVAATRPARNYQGSVELFIEEMKAIGLDLKVKSFDYSTMRAKQNSGDYEGFVFGADGVATAMSHLTVNYRTGGGKNGMQLSDPIVDEWIDRIVSTVDEDERVKETIALQEYISENVMWKIPLADTSWYWLSHPWVKGYLASPAYYEISFSFDRMWIDK